ncbi:MAG: hypothetical protein AAGF87_00830 [Bacteroidota bacterium]
MLKNWLQDPQSSNSEHAAWPDWAIGQNIVPRSFSRSTLAKVKLAIIGIDQQFASQVRKSLFKLSWDFNKLALMDLGDLRKSNPEFLIPLLRELGAGKVVPIVIGASRDRFRAQYQAFQAVKSQVAVAVIDQRIRLKTQKSRVSEGYSLNPAFHNQRKKLYHLSHLGAQRHLVDPALFDLLDGRGYDNIRLGDLRHKLSAAEPILRDADLLGVDLSALQLATAPAQSDPSTAGLLVEEAAQLCRYAGLSDKLQSFGIYGFDDTATERHQMITAELAAQLIWYFCDGFSKRWGDFPVTNKGLVEYVVDHPSYNNLTFWRSKRSGRWWVQSPAFKHRGEDRHKLVACNKSDYEAASRGELPERLLAAFSR